MVFDVPGVGGNCCLRLSRVLSGLTSSLFYRVRRSYLSYAWFFLLFNILLCSLPEVLLVLRIVIVSGSCSFIDGWVCFIWAWFESIWDRDESAAPVGHSVCFRTSLLMRFSGVGSNGYCGVFLACFRCIIGRSEDHWSSLSTSSQGFVWVDGLYVLSRRMFVLLSRSVLPPTLHVVVLDSSINVVVPGSLAVSETAGLWYWDSSGRSLVLASTESSSLSPVVGLIGQGLVGWPWKSSLVWLGEYWGFCRAPYQGWGGQKYGRVWVCVHLLSVKNMADLWIGGRLVSWGWVGGFGWLIGVVLVMYGNFIFV